MAVTVKDAKVSGKLFWKRHKTSDEWTEVELERSNGSLKAFLLNQPSAGKPNYYIELTKVDESVTVPANYFVTIRFKYVFDDYWTGFPFGHDLTDNKTAFALIGWLIALFMYKKSPNPKKWALVGAVVLIIVYLIPYSVLGSELDYNKIETENSKIELQIENK
ncbi:MAG: hypothetical protein KJ799_11360 [Bacteroidetes bacterium]|nr:hypothetical protein [Bacteroidota bacterium]MBU1678980.1 hypothetical protein [Bacteroidota bacterium]MBU2507305.1 hypothetical protein [Bacteroidota bacterium]